MVYCARLCPAGYLHRSCSHCPNSSLPQLVVISPELNFFDKSQSFCRQNLFEISQSTRCLYKNIQSTKSIKIDTRHTNNSIVWNQRHDFMILLSGIRAVIFSKPNFFDKSQIFLPTKFIWDLTEHKVLIQNMKTIKPIQNGTNT